MKDKLTLIWTGLALAIASVLSWLMDHPKSERRAELADLRARWLAKYRANPLRISRKGWIDFGLAVLAVAYMVTPGTFASTLISKQIIFSAGAALAIAEIVYLLAMFIPKRKQ